LRRKRQTNLERNRELARELLQDLTEMQCREVKIAASTRDPKGAHSMISVSICSPSPGICEQWHDLVARASPNVFMDPAALTAASDARFAKIHMLLAWEQHGAQRKLVGVWALQVRKISPFWPALFEALPYNYAFLSNPVIDPAFMDDVIPAFFAAIAKNPALPNVINLQSFNAEASGYDAILTALVARRGEQLKLSENARPFVTREFGVKRSGSTRKKLRQDWNRLSALGSVDIVNDRTPGGAREAFEAFLALEADSWKGARGTALLCDEKDAAFVRELVGHLSEQRNASVALLRLDGRAIAAQVLMYCGTMAYTWKTAFNADYAKYSPGALLVDKITEDLFSKPGIDAIDSCSAEGGFMAQLWAGRRKMVDLLIDVGPGKSLGFRVEAARQFGYRRLRALRDRLRAGTWTFRSKKIGLAVPN
jgi:CelD/BcsL family acetyltransferase involved in cellulose biosynthesis